MTAGSQEGGSEFVDLLRSGMPFDFTSQQHVLLPAYSFTPTNTTTQPMYVQPQLIHPQTGLTGQFFSEFATEQARQPSNRQQNSFTLKVNGLEYPVIGQVDSAAAPSESQETVAPHDEAAFVQNFAVAPGVLPYPTTGYLPTYSSPSPYMPLGSLQESRLVPANSLCTFPVAAEREINQVFQGAAWSAGATAENYVGSTTPDTVSIDSTSDPQLASEAAAASSVSNRDQCLSGDAAPAIDTLQCRELAVSADTVKNLDSSISKLSVSPSRANGARVDLNNVAEPTKPRSWADILKATPPKHSTTVQRKPCPMSPLGKDNKSVGAAAKLSGESQGQGLAVDQRVFQSVQANRTAQEPSSKQHQAGRVLSKPPKQITTIETSKLKGSTLDRSKINPKDFNTNVTSARFFVIKSYSEDDVYKAIKYNMWASTDSGNRRLDAAFCESSSKGPIYLFFSVNASGRFCGMAEMISPLDFSKKLDCWQQDKWNGTFKLKWIFLKDIPNRDLRHIRLVNNENKPVTNSRDTQEIFLAPGKELLKIFKTYDSKTSILDDYDFYEQSSSDMQDQKTNGMHPHKATTRHPAHGFQKALPASRPSHPFHTSRAQRKYSHQAQRNPLHSG